jgi:hypothetical protein
MGRSSKTGFVASSAERFVGPLARRVSRLTPGRIGGRPEARRSGGEAQMGEDLPDDRRPPVCRVGTGRLNDGKDLHRPAAGSEERIHLVDLADCCLR